MTSIKSPLLAILLTGLSIAAHAQEDGYSPTYSACMKASDGVTVEMLDCASAEIKRHDARLNMSYDAAMMAFENPLQIQLRDAQRQWIKFRDTDCRLLGSLSGGGTMDSINESSCLLKKTKSRADELEWLARFAEEMQ